jgi:hypothetical protein
MTTYQWLCLLGVPSLLIAAMLAMIRHLATQIKHDRADTAATKLGVQALLRAQMIADYNKWHRSGLRPDLCPTKFRELLETVSCAGSQRRDG